MPFNVHSSVRMQYWLQQNISYSSRSTYTGWIFRSAAAWIITQPEKKFAATEKLQWCWQINCLHHRPYQNSLAIFCQLLKYMKEHRTTNDIRIILLKFSLNELAAILWSCKISAPAYQRKLDKLSKQWLCASKLPSRKDEGRIIRANFWQQLIRNPSLCRTTPWNTYSIYVRYPTTEILP